MPSGIFRGCYFQIARNVFIGSWFLEPKQLPLVHLFSKKTENINTHYSRLMCPKEEHLVLVWGGLDGPFRQLVNLFIKKKQEHGQLEIIRLLKWKDEKPWEKALNKVSLLSIVFRALPNDLTALTVGVLTLN